MRRFLGVLVVLGGPIWYARRRDRREQVHVHFDDGSTVSLTDGNPGASRLLALARQGL
jgi:hypothetical protein